VDVRQILADPTVLELLASAIPARLAFTAPDGAPRVQPIWFYWDGSQFIMNTGQDNPKAKALRRDPRVALTIDSEAGPYRSLQVRGLATLETVPGVAPEYELMAARHYGEALGKRWIESVLARRSDSARIAIEPTWAYFLDMAKVFPDLFDQT